MVRGEELLSDTKKAASLILWLICSVVQKSDVAARRACSLRRHP